MWLLEASSNLEAALALARRRANGEPLQYLTGVAGFRHLELAVGPGVLVPRPETEQVAQRALDLLPQGGTLVDIGTGSGAIALSVASERRDAAVWATDISAAALRWARSNADRLKLKVETLEGDLFAPLPERLKGHVDVVVANPPYVGTDEADSLPLDVVDHEPHLALFADDGLSVIRRLVDEAPRWLAPRGWLVLEISERHPAEVEEMLRERGFRDVFVEQDLAGKARIASGSAPR